jgi:hypothetical protein
MEEPRTALETWASTHGYTPSDEEIGGATPLLRSGLIDTTDQVYRGRLEDRDVLVAEFSIGSPDWSEQFGGSGTDSSVFTVMLVAVDPGRWPRLTVHPRSLSDHQWLRRLIRSDRDFDDLPEAFHDRYRVIASTDISDEQLRGLFTEELAAWWVSQPSDVLVDVEDHDEHGSFLTVAHAGVADGPGELDDLVAQTTHLMRLIDP